MSPDHLYLLALQHHQSGRLPEAEAAYRQILTAYPHHADARHRLGILLHQTARTTQAIDAIYEAVRLNPSAADYHTNLGAVLAAAAWWSEALNAFQSSLALGANFPETHNNIGNVLRQQGRLTEAIAAYRQAVLLRPDYPDAWHSLGTLLKSAGDLDGAEDAFAKAVALRPQWPEALNNLAGVYLETRRANEAIDLFRRAIAIQNDPRIWDNLLLAMHGHDGDTPQQIAQAHSQWNAACAMPLLPLARPLQNDPSPTRRLRIGYVSPDFREHPVGRLMVPVLAHHDHAQFEIICYSDARQIDPITEVLRSAADAWIDSSSLSDQALADRIRHDRIDLLVDLTLHTANNRLLVFAQKPAPVQLTWAGYPATTGLSTIAFRLSDPHLDPPAADPFRNAWYSEKALRLPNCFWCFDPQTPEPPVNDLPSARTGFITFGCLNQFGKITDPTLVRWAQVLSNVPRSRLLLLGPPGRARIALANHMATLQIDPTRIHFADRAPRPDYLKLYHQIDICLDTFPYTGHTTTLDALWMGVPVVTRFGQTTVSRGGLSILSNLGLEDLIAPTDEAFLQIATNLANDPSHLISLRSTLRPRLMSSPIANCRQFTKDLESSFQTAWQGWCNRSRQHD